MRKIEELSQQELLGLIYHHLPRTLFYDHPVECACCGTHPGDMPVTVKIEWSGGTAERIVYPMYYVCDECTNLMYDMQNPTGGESNETR